MTGRPQGLYRPEKGRSKVRQPDDQAKSSADLTTLARSSADLTTAAEGVWYAYPRGTGDGMTLT